ncbi:hypothetical protein BaRGS_00014776 [Batillaria attramentaria]|uniref:Uncharacterized protein n=1 Tax=Batillaria attramentaria TaxID=370345 RepID=A0ABD0L3B0_9CAEN
MFTRTAASVDTGDLRLVITLSLVQTSGGRRWASRRASLPSVLANYPDIASLRGKEHHKASEENLYKDQSPPQTNSSPGRLFTVMRVDTAGSRGRTHVGVGDRKCNHTPQTAMM